MKPDRSRNVFRYFAVRLGLIFVIMVIVVVVILTRFPPTRVCTLMGCNDSLSLEFSHPINVTYTLQLTTSTGEITQITCTTASAQGQISPAANISAMCQPDSVIIYNYTPKQLTILVSWQANSYTTTAAPTYQSVQPNGPNCPPTCSQATWQLELP